MHSFRRFILPILMIMFFVLTLFNISHNHARPTQIENATLDLSTWNSNQIIDLDGEWEFFDQSLSEDISGFGTLVNVPHYWNDNPIYNNLPYGYATYRLTITGLTEEKVYGISLIDSGISYRLTANGHEVMSNGVVSRTSENYVPYSRSEVGYFSPDSNGIAVITMEISNYNHYQAGFWLPISMSNGSTLFNHEIMHFVILALLFGINMALGIYFVTLHLLSRKEYKALCLGLFSILISIRLIVTGHRLILFLFPLLPWNTIVRMEYVIGMLLLPVFGLFISRMQFIPIKEHLERFYLGLSLLIIVVGVSIPVIFLNDMLTLFKFLVIGFSPFYIYTLISGLKNRVRGSFLMLSTVLIMLVAVILEFFFDGSLYNFFFASFIMISFMSIAIADEFLVIKAFSKSLELEIVIDPLTNVYNRLYLNKLIENESSGRNPLTGYYELLFLDLDNFKNTNDTYGHLLGDEILTVISKRMRSFFGEQSIIIRYGGDEFIVLHESTAETDIESTIASFKEYLEEVIYIDGNAYFVKGTIGHSSYHSKHNRLEDVIKNSDANMYLKKQSMNLDQT
ncbi:MAG: diguanylate cyclase [Firmicutes bacterium]|nr:diguanylate cyclase [Bacillota bacterium]